MHYDLISQLGALQSQLRACVPLIHNMTNYVTVNDVANAVLAIGASPIMADDLEEAGDIASISNALVLNIGTLNQRTIASMLSAGQSANGKGIPIVFDPVGAGASRLRNETSEKMLNTLQFAVVRGNLSELSYLSGLSSSTKGVDASEADMAHDPALVARQVALQYHCVAAVTGAVDVISNGTQMIEIHNGHPMLSKVTGTGCMTSALVGAYLGAGADPFLAAAAGILSMGIAGELAFETHGATGTGSFHIGIIDALSRLDGNMIQARAKAHVSEH